MHKIDRIIQQIRVYYPNLSDENALTFLEKATYKQLKNKDIILTPDLSSTHSFSCLRDALKGLTRIEMTRKKL